MVGVYSPVNSINLGERAGLARRHKTVQHENGETEREGKKGMLTDQPADHERKRLEQKQYNSHDHQLFGAHVFNNCPGHVDKLKEDHHE